MSSTSFNPTRLGLALLLALMAPLRALHAAEPAAPAADAGDAVSSTARAALEQLLGMGGAASASGGASSGKAEAAAEPRATTTVREGETLDRIIRRTMGNTPFKDSLLQAAFVEANPRAYPNGSIQRLPVGTVLNVPSASDLRRHLLRVLGADRAAALAGNAPATAPGPGAATAVAAAKPASAAVPAPPPRPDHRGWVRFPG